MDNHNNFIYAISTSEKFINNGLEDWSDPILSLVSSSRFKILEKIYNLYEDYGDTIEITVEIWFDGEDEFYSVYYPTSQIGKPAQEAIKYYKQELDKYEKELIKQYNSRFTFVLTEFPKKIDNGFLISCEKLFKDEKGKNHYKASFQFDVLNSRTNEKCGKCIIDFPNLACDCYLEDFIGHSPELLNINIYSSSKNGFKEKTAIEIEIK